MVDDGELLRRMVAIHEEHGGVVLALLRVTPDEISAYGSAAVAEVSEGVMRVDAVVEKPAPEDAPSDLAVIGRYVLPSEIFAAIDRVEPGVGGEIQLTDAIGDLIGKVPVHGCVFTTGRYDVGQKQDYLRAIVEIALAQRTSAPLPPLPRGSGRARGAVIPLEENGRTFWPAVRPRPGHRAGGRFPRAGACRAGRGPRGGATVRQHGDGRFAVRAADTAGASEGHPARPRIVGTLRRAHGPTSSGVGRGRADHDQAPSRRAPTV